MIVLIIITLIVRISIKLILLIIPTLIVRISIKLILLNSTTFIVHISTTLIVRVSTNRKLTTFNSRTFYQKKLYDFILFPLKKPTMNRQLSFKTFLF